MLIAIALLACKTEPVDSDFGPGVPVDLHCPGSADCATAEGALGFGIAKVSVVPTCYEHWVDLNEDAVWNSGEEFFDCGCDRLCPEDDGYPGTDDGEADETFQGVWLAGFHNRRPGNGTRGADVGTHGENDGLWAHAAVIVQGETSLALVSVDSIGIMYDDVLAYRHAVRDAGIDVDHVLIQSTHDHESPDMMGIYGPSTTVTGRIPQYADQIGEAVVQAVGEAVASAVPATMRVGSVDSSTYDDDGTANLIRDSRDPWIVDPTVQVISFLDGSDNTIGTMVNWANHPETVADENVLFTSDYVHALRESVSHGVTWDGESKPGVGGITMFMNGTVGGMMTSLGVNVDTPDGETGGSASFEKADAIGQLVGGMALDALAGGQDVEAPSLAFATKTFELNVDNQAFQAMFLLGVLDHRKAVFDESQPLSDDNVPVVTTEMDIVDLGPVRMLSVPGELLPELAIGGYDGSYTPATRDIIDPGNDNPPDLAAAPRGPYLKDDMGADYNWILGLGNDELGYIVPPYNFKLNQAAPYILEDFGDHYEETNSLGVDTAPKILEEAAILIDWMNEQ